ncbi:MAG: hybrid sensor histidine kinase/response regulator [bacterium]|nr:hybrid sensor histidine kinase/response regulator [bacterium]
MNGVIAIEGSLVLIVDDTLQNIQVLGSVLRNAKLQVSVAQTGKQALVLAEKLKPDLILLDVMMPEMDGFTACRELKAREATRDIPVIFLTAKVQAEDIVRGLELGAVDYITKPFNATELLVRVRNHLERTLGQRKIVEQNDERRELLHILCHDLANSFSSIMSFLSIEDEELAENLPVFKPLMVSSAQNGLDLIGMVRQMRALDEGKIALKPQIHCLRDMVDRSMSLLDRRFEAKRIEVQIEVSRGLWVEVEEISFVNSVLNNLLTNAVKFSPSGSSVTITAQAAGQEICLCVGDQGIGIPEAVQRHLFDVNKSASRLGTEGEVGTGFGLPLVAKFVERYGGRIEINSMTSGAQSGTRVCVYLPAAVKG